MAHRNHIFDPLLDIKTFNTLEVKQETENFLQSFLWVYVKIFIPYVVNRHIFDSHDFPIVPLLAISGLSHQLVPNLGHLTKLLFDLTPLVEARQEVH